MLVVGVVHCAVSGGGGDSSREGPRNSCMSRSLSLPSDSIPRADLSAAEATETWQCEYSQAPTTQTPHSSV